MYLYKNSKNSAFYKVLGTNEYVKCILKDDEPCLCCIIKPTIKLKLAYIIKRAIKFIKRERPWMTDYRYIRESEGI